MKTKYTFFVLILSFCCFQLHAQYVVDFENVTKANYAAATVDINGINWSLNGALVGTLANDFKNGAKSGRLISEAGTVMAMLEDKTDGLGQLSFVYRRFGTDAASSWKVELSTNNGVSWTAIGSTFTGTAIVQTFYAAVHITGNIRIRIIPNTINPGRRINIDDIVLTDYSGENPYLGVSLSKDHGSACLNSTALTHQYTILNSGTLEANGISVTSNNPQFAISNLSSTAIAPSGSATYDVSFTPSAIGQQSGDVTVNSTSPNSNTVTSLLKGTGLDVPILTTNPTNANATLSETATFQVISPNTISYQWQVSTDLGNTWMNVTEGLGADTTSYTTIPTTSAMHNNSYRCQLTNTCGMSISSAGILSVFHPKPNRVDNFQVCMTDTSANLSWNTLPTTPTGYMVFVLEGTTAPAGVLSDANSYTSNSDFTIAPLASPSLGKVVYKGIGSTINITNLPEDAIYSFAVFTYNSETQTGWSTARTNVNNLAQGDIRNLNATTGTNKVTLTWNNPMPVTCWDQLIIVANQGTVDFEPSGIYPIINSNYETANSIVYSTELNTTNKTIEGLENGLNYCFKLFVRRGVQWTEGIEICAIPEITYCTSFGSTSTAGIESVLLNTLNNTATSTSNSYSDFTNLSTVLEINQAYDMTVNITVPNGQIAYTRVWIDWNINGQMDLNETYELGTLENSGTSGDVTGESSASPFHILVPSTAILGKTRMRVSTKLIDTPTPCEKNFDGEVEDYTIFIQRSATPEINIRGGNISISNGFNAPYALNNTLFATTDINQTTLPKSFSIQNLGLADLLLTGTPAVTLIGAHPEDFNIVTQPSSNILPSNTTQTFEINFSPTSDGVRTAIVSINNNDPTGNEDPYLFLIKGTGRCNSTITSMINPNSGPVHTEIRITSSSNLTNAIAFLNGIPMPIISSSTAVLVVKIPEDGSSGNLKVILQNGCSTSQSFTVVDSRVSGCEIDALAAIPSDICITEITDASSGTLTFIEIYNGTNDIVDLANYKLHIYNNGSSEPNKVISLTGNLAPNTIYIVQLGNTTCELNDLSVAPNQLENTFGGINFALNSSDAIAIFNVSTSQIIDIFGTYQDETWANGLGVGNSGVNFRRKNNANLLPSPTFVLSDWDMIDWTNCLDSDYSDIGFFDFSPGHPPRILVQPHTASEDCKLSTTLSLYAEEGYNPPLGDTKELRYQWFYNAPENGIWIPIPLDHPDLIGGLTSDLSIASTLAYESYQFYCQVREDDITCFTASHAVGIKLNKTIWTSGNWNNGIPDTSKIAIINQNYNTFNSGSFSACSLVINSGYEVNVTDNHFIEIQNDVILHANTPMDFATLTIATKGAFVQRGDDSSAGTFVLKPMAKSRVHKSTALKQQWYDYTYWSSPVINETIENALSIAPADRRYYFNALNFVDNNDDDIDDNGDDWTIASGVMGLGIGYASTSNTAGPTFPRIDLTTFEGSLNTGNIETPITSHTSNTGKKWNFIGNPYPSAIDFKALYQTNNSAIEGVAYLWSQSAPPSAANPGNQQLNFSVSDYAIIAAGSGNTAGSNGIIPSDYIPSAQGFFVIAKPTGSQLSFKNSMRMADDSSNSHFYRQLEDSVDNRIWLNLSSETGVFSQILIAYIDGATDGLDDYSFDAPRNLSSEASAYLYTEIPGSSQKFTIQGKSIESLILSETIPVGFLTSILQQTLYKIDIAHAEGPFFEMQTVYLKDHLYNIEHDLSASFYAFNSAAGNFKDRFELVFRTHPLNTNTPTLTNQDLSIVELKSGKVQFSIGHNVTIRQVEIIDLLGRSLYKFPAHKTKEVFDLSGLNQSAYIAIVTLSNGQILHKRAIKQR